MQRIVFLRNYCWSLQELPQYLRCFVVTKDTNVNIAHKLRGLLLNGRETK